MTSSFLTLAQAREEERRLREQEQEKHAIHGIGTQALGLFDREVSPAVPGTTLSGAMAGEPAAEEFTTAGTPAVKLSDALGPRADLYRSMLTSGSHKLVPEAISGMLRAFEPKRFKLGEGEQYVEEQPGGGTRTIAQGPPKYRAPVSVRPGGTVLDPITQEPIYRAPTEPRVVAPGSSLVDTNAAAPQPVYTAPERVNVGTTANEVAGELFGQPFNALNQNQKAAVNAIVQQRRVAVSAAQGAAGVVAKTEAERGMALGAERAVNFLHPQTGAIAPPEMSETQAIAAGYRFVTPEQRQQLADLNNTRVIVEQVKQLSDALITAESAPAAALQGAQLKAGAFARTNPLAATYEDQKQSFLGILSRSLGGERGVLTDRDIYRISAALPSFFDTRAVKDAKINLIGVLLDTATQGKRAAIFGEQPGQGITERVQAIIRELEGAGGASAPQSTPTAPAERQPPKAPQRGIDKLSKAGPIITSVRAGQMSRAQARAALVREAGFRADEADGFLDTIMGASGGGR